jgi:(p)ppGpp synthase/HD superfamily hydrolase
MILRAAAFAALAHAGQVRKYTGEPYVTHCLAVGALVADRTMDPHVIAAAVLHDVVEDTPTTIWDVNTVFGGRVATLVGNCTDYYVKSRYPDLNRDKRKALEAERIGACCADTQLIKGCDMLHNWGSIRAYDPDFAVVFVREKRRMLECMTKLDPHVVLQLKEVA